MPHRGADPVRFRLTVVALTPTRRRSTIETKSLPSENLKNAVLPALKWDCQAADRRAGYITPIEAAELLAVSVKSVYKLASSGEVEALHVGRSVRIKADSLCEFIRRNTCRGRGSGGPRAGPRPHAPSQPREARPRKKKGPAFVFLPPPS